MSCLTVYRKSRRRAARASAAIWKLWPEIPVVACHHITREWREYESTNTAVLSGLCAAHRRALPSRSGTGFGSQGFKGQLLCHAVELRVSTPSSVRARAHHHGGVGTGERLLGSGGARASDWCPNALALDIGGTTAKCSLIENGQVKIMTDYWIERSSLRRATDHGAVVDLVEISNGGAARVRSTISTSFHVGPRSAGASPVPRPTVAEAPTLRRLTRTSHSVCINAQFSLRRYRRGGPGAVDRALDEVASSSNDDTESRRRAASCVLPIATWSMR